MKNKILLVLPATAAYSYLFYMQTPGMNHAVFGLVITVFFALTDLSLLKNKTWLAAAASAIACGILIGVNGTELNFVMHFISIMVLSYVTINAKISVLTGIAYSGISTIGGFMVGVFSKLANYATTSPAQTPVKEKKFQWYYFLLPLFILILFIILYRESSAGFRKLTDLIDLSFISGPWFFFTFSGFVFLYGLFIRPKELQFFEEEAGLSNEIEGAPTWKTNGFFKTGLILFIMLDALLTLVNVSDIIYLSLYEGQDKGMTYAELIHQGIGALIVSLVLAVTFIMLWFNQKNTDPQLKRVLTIAAIAWIVLNLVLIGTNIWKNTLYINAHGLTYKRIGVYFFLFLALLTLGFCGYKIKTNKNNVFLYRRFGIVIFCLTFIFNCFHWDKIVTRNNIALLKYKSMTIDGWYLLELSSDCLPLLVENWEAINPAGNPAMDKRLDERCMEFNKNFESQNWRGLTLNNYKTYEQIKKYKPKTEFVYTESR
ncbi:MAG TPA: DUF4173 domain-containing protein [Flavobacteriales bacterium]|nr:DUF4173 domain-containing protein [Flavobacteriales bacterium]